MLNDAGNFSAVCFSFVLYFSISFFSSSSPLICAFYQCSFCAHQTLAFTIYIRNCYSDRDKQTLNNSEYLMKSSVVVQWIVNSLLANFLKKTMCGRAPVNVYYVRTKNARTFNGANTFHVHVIIYILLGKSAMKWIALRKSSDSYNALFIPESEKWNRILKRETIKPGNKEQFTFPPVSSSPCVSSLNSDIRKKV